MSGDRTIVVIGNGPSLRGFDLTRLKHVDTLGMNAAYRHWDRIGWYPTYYACVDDQLIQTHHLEIKRLVEDKSVLGAFVHASFFDLHPECAGDPRYWSHDQFTTYGFKRSASKQGLEHIVSPAFKMRDTMKVTTGAHAVRFAAFLGYTKLAILGVDLRYVEMLPEAKAGEGTKLEMVSTPVQNPNYFFDDYQRAGDRFNVPNPAVHDGGLHLEAFRALRDDLVENLPDVTVVNCNPASGLHEQAIFPFEPIEATIGESQLGAVMVPCTARDKDRILANLQRWAKPAFVPFLGKKPNNLPRLVFVFNNAAGTVFPEIAAAFEHLDLGRFFSGIECHDLDLRGTADTYRRGYDQPVGAGGFKAGPNNQFFMTLELGRTYGRYMFQMEADCVAVRPNWLGRLVQIVNTAEPFFIMGSAYRGGQIIAKAFARHINGNAVYAAGDDQFIAFVNDVWKPSLAGIIATKDRRIAYDCLLEILFSQMESDVQDDATFRMWQSVAHKIRYTDYLQDLSAEGDVASMDAERVNEILRSSTETYLIHCQSVLTAEAPDPKAGLP